MSKTLVIQEANFRDNRLDRVLFGEEVPCTGITLSEEAISATSFDPITVTYTLTPSNTTDEVEWASSDESVATVHNGVISIFGIGSCTITATCGTQSASATLTVGITLTPVFTWGSVNILSNHMYYTDATAYFISSGTGNQAIQYDIPKYNDASAKLYPILIPNGTAKIKVSRSGTGVNTLFYNSNRNLIYFKNESCGDVDAITAAKYVGGSTETVNLCTTASQEFVVPDGVNAFIFLPRCGTSYTDTPAADVAANMGLTFEFLTE